MSESSDNWIASTEAERFDIELAIWDCKGTEAHVLMLEKEGILTKKETEKILEALDEIKEIAARGDFRYEPGYGAQLTLEKMIVDRIGPDAGYRVHTGRSRNDQVLVAQKLYTRDVVLKVAGELLLLLEALIDLADKEKETIMPGYTHMQPARPTTLSQWAAAYSDMFIRDFERIKAAYKRNDSSPLGAAESHGTSWGIDRDYTRGLLGFKRVEEIPLDAISSRGESDADFLSAISFISLHISKMAQDLILFNTYEFDYFRLGAKQAQRMGKLTGSSIMPQKKNPDVLELLRAQASEIYSYNFHALEVLKGLPTGYNRDSRDTKAPIIRGLKSIQESIRQASGVIEGSDFNRDKMAKAARENYSMAPDLAEFLSQKYSIPFREMHGIVGRVVRDAIEKGVLIEDIKESEIKKSAKEAGYSIDVKKEDIKSGTDVQQAISRRDNIGGASKKRMANWVKKRKKRLNKMKKWLAKKEKRISLSEEIMKKARDK